MKNSFVLVLAILLSLSAGALGSFFTTPAIDGWYMYIVKPALNPPNWIFGPVWTVLYVLMGVASFLVWKKGWRNSKVRSALFMFLGQLVLNSLWSIVFFGLQSILGALIIIILLWLMILATIILFARVSRTAAWLLVPYIAWVSFATYLNYSIYILN